ncbi:MAG: hypothetical protein NT105_20550 [Verrucomicrobia bacterium]|nr:hypothetical protein [Verrucomicrobiota bacterium]
MKHTLALLTALLSCGLLLNLLLIRKTLGTHPVAERLLRNLLNYAAGQSK